MDTLSSLVSRGLFAVAFVLAIVGGIEWIASLFGYTILRQSYAPGRLFELATAAMVFVIALLLRQIREELRAQRA